jgi:hypothetical protein
LKNRGFLESLIDYRSDFGALFTVLKDEKLSDKVFIALSLYVFTYSPFQVGKVFKPELTSAADVHGSLKDCLEVTVAGLVFFLQDHNSYKELLACHGTDVQILLDLLQDVGISFPTQF